MSTLIAPVEHLYGAERFLAKSMAQAVGVVAVQGPDGRPSYSVNQLAERYAQDPKDALGVARESLLSIGSDRTLSPEQKRRTLGNALDSVFGLTIKLDHAAFPPSKPGEVKHGVPSYVPDGFIDMGKEGSLDPRLRDREQLLVDKAAIFMRYKPFLTELLSKDYSNFGLQAKKRHFVDETAKEIYFGMQYDITKMNMGGDVVKLSQVSEGVCRHQAMAFQVLCQTLGIKSQPLKARMDGEHHSTNMVRLDGQWNIYDVTNPDYVVNAKGQKEWRPGIFPVDGPPESSRPKTYHVVNKHSGVPHIYAAHDQMYWRIDPAAAK